jgi:hypothetical protein
LLNVLILFIVTNPTTSYLKAMFTAAVPETTWAHRGQFTQTRTGKGLKKISKVRWESTQNQI